MSSRRFKPAILAELGGDLLVVDDKQPVAVLISPGGRFASVVSWSQFAPPPQVYDPDRRRVIYRRHDEVCVTDGPLVPPVVLSQRRGALAVEQREVDLAAWGPPHSPHLFRRVRRVDQESTAWFFRSRGAGPRTNAVLTRHRPGSEVREWDLGSGSVSDALILDGIPYVCIRRADKRPWQFDPPRDLWKIADDTPTRLEVDIDISDRCWPPRPYLEDELARAFDRVRADVQMAVEYGATDVRVVVEDLDRLPSLRLYFTLPGDRRYVRTDQPFDELGCATGGLAALTIILDEDLHAGLPSARAAVDGLTPV